ncbi:MAG: hypothetical protein KC731_13265 [Myxococcales bacterium]|nr:hypothetical protein [Myxococcales bacterium]
MRARLNLLLLALLLLATGACGPTQAKQAETSLDIPRIDTGQEPRVIERTLLSKSYHIDKKYRSMLGPSSMEKLKLLDTDKPELLWIVGYQAVVMDQEGKGEVSQEFMCHSNLDFDPHAYWKNFKSNASMSGRLFTLSQGQQNIVFPRGFGIPVMSDMEFDLATQVLNLNLDDPNLDVRHKVTIRFVRDAEVPFEMKPLFQAAVQGMKSLQDLPGHYGVSMSEKDEGKHGAGCSVGLPAVAGDADVDQHGQKFTGHWVVKPGREENRTNVTRFLQLQFDTKIHYIAVHLHPFAESLELIDRTTGEQVFKAIAQNHEGKIGLKSIDYYESKEGIPILKDHEYELVSVYNNTTNEDQDSMAVMYLYLHDKNFHKPAPVKTASN